MQGRRLPDGKAADGRNPAMSAGDYWKDENGQWHVCPPGGELGSLSLSKHTVIEEDNGTITVIPSIYQKPVPRHWKSDIPGWHGFLEKGIWRQV